MNSNNLRENPWICVNQDIDGDDVIVTLHRTLPSNSTLANEVRLVKSEKNCRVYGLSESDVDDMIVGILRPYRDLSFCTKPIRKHPWVCVDHYCESGRIMIKIHRDLPSGSTVAGEVTILKSNCHKYGMNEFLVDEVILQQQQQLSIEDDDF